MTITPPSFSEIWFLIKNGWYDFINTDFNSLKYAGFDLAVKVGTVVAAFVLLKLLWILICKIFGWNKYSRMDSGHTVSHNSERGFLAGFFLTLPKTVLLVPLSAIIVGIADPFLAVNKEERKNIETRTRMDFRDASGSMGVLFKQSGKSKAEIAMDAHLRFLDIRRGKNDRTAFWIFSNDPYPIQEDFVVDDELYYLKVLDAPWEIGVMSPELWTEEQWAGYPVPQSRYLSIDGQGGTQLSTTLKVALQLFDSDEKKQKKTPYYKSGKRSILIVTDAAISDFDKVKIDFEELSKRRITPYIIFIDDSAGEQHPNQLANAPELLQEVIDRGGKFFPVSDEKAIENAYREIDKLEMGKVEIERKNFKIPVFYKFIFFAVISFAAAILLGLLSELLLYP
ncbi:MAG: VWA domain-containing protein [Candidatus Yanofskybacteria bacterium]|nr:VWA domain-containing protein [Candidatus Yanofskybacteria bacterium]